MSALDPLDHEPAPAPPRRLIELVAPVDDDAPPHSDDDAPPSCGTPEAVDEEPAGRGRGRPSVSSKLVALAAERYRFTIAPDGTPYAVPRFGPRVARGLDIGRPSLRAELAAAYYTETNQTPARSALVDALAVIEGEAQQASPEPVHLRCALDGTSVAVDLGTTTGEALVITAGDWRVRERSPVLFRRTELTGALPAPERGGSIDALARLINVRAEDFGVYVGWLVATLLPWPRPILLFGGEQGTGKSSAARTTVSLVDPSPAPLRTAPRDVESWVTAAAGSNLVALDNISAVPDWLSDALCRASTGDALVRRKLYTDSGLAVTTIRRAVILTTIDAGALRGDLAERLLMVELERIDPSERRSEDALEAALDDARAKILGALADMVAGVLATLPTVEVPNPPRMVDFARVLAALDHVTGWATLDRYRQLVDEVVADIVSGDPLAAALVEVGRAGFTGTASQLLDTLAGHRPDNGAWPRSANRLSGAVKRYAPSLRASGVDVTQWRGHRGVRHISLSPRKGDDGDDGDGPPFVATSKMESEEAGISHDVSPRDRLDRHHRHQKGPGQWPCPSCGEPTSQLYGPSVPPVCKPCATGSAEAKATTPSESL